MSKTIDLGVEQDHIESQTKANGLTAISELIWNALDADASEIQISYKPTGLGGYEYISIADNGHGLTYEKAQEVFARLGGSEKKTKTKSPGGRPYHGKEGKGRYKSLALGDLVEFISVYEAEGNRASFSIKLDRNHITKTEFSDLTKTNEPLLKTGLEVIIHNVDRKNADQVFSLADRSDLEERFASYWITYPNFKITVNGQELQFQSIIRNTEEEVVALEKNEVKYVFTIKQIEWTIENKKKAYLCSNAGIPFLEINLGLRSSIPISVFIQSEYIESLQRRDRIDFWQEDELVSEVYRRAKVLTRDYLRKRAHFYSHEFINDLKKKDLYPYRGNAENIVEETKRQVFDIVALQINEFLPSFSDQDDKSKKLTLRLVSEALENDPEHLQKILGEVIGLPVDKREELSDLLEHTSLTGIIDSMSEIKNRLQFLNGLEQIIYNPELHDGFKERKHLHKIIVRETWIFGDQYTYGVDDQTLKNVLKAYLHDFMGRDDFEETVEGGDNKELQTIPDVCLWSQFSMGSQGVENLFIELKKPGLDAGIKERLQIESYAAKVANDPRFPKERTRWKFILVTRGIKPDLEPSLHQVGRRYGHISETANSDIYILPWGTILSEAKQRLQFIKEKLNFNLIENEHGLSYIKEKYKQYLPGDFGAALAVPDLQAVMAKPVATALPKLIRLP